MEIKFQGTPNEVVKQMQDFLATINVEMNTPTSTKKEVLPFIELTGNPNDVERIRDLKEVFKENGVDWLTFKRDNNLLDTRIKRNNKQFRGVRGIKIIDN